MYLAMILVMWLTLAVLLALTAPPLRLVDGLMINVWLAKEQVK